MHSTGSLIDRFSVTLLYFSALAPLASGMASINFFLNAKVYTHQALYVYTQPYESGGRLMYTMNSFFLAALYVVTVIFGLHILAVGGKAHSLGFMIASTTLTVSIHRRIQTRFVLPSRIHPYTIARLIDKENESRFRNKAVQLCACNTNQSSLDNAAAEDKILPCLPGQRCSRDLDHVSDDNDEGKTTHPNTSVADLQVTLDPHEGVGCDDTFLYRQPELNKAAW